MMNPRNVFSFLFLPCFFCSLFFFSAAELQRDYAKNFTDLESQDDLWAKDSDPFEGLREAVGQRHDLLEAIVENANRCKFVCVFFYFVRKRTFCCS
jgi:hypothetical protein